MLEAIGRYRVERRLGSGAFATVWLARDEQLDAQLAIKVLAENWMHDDDVRRRFTEEARILWRLDSERIIRVHTVDELPDGRPYFVMDLAEGGNLEDRMRERAQEGQPFTVDEAVGIAAAIADGLAVAHGRGVVHRDLKPSNVMFRRTPEGGERVVLADFGIARSLEAAGATTISAGTPHYMAPEQTEGRADRGSDVYAAAVVLYELLAGTVPFPFPSAGQVMRAQLTGAAPDVRLARPEVPPPLAAAVARGLEGDPARRYATAEEWRSAITGSTPEPPAVPIPLPLPSAAPDPGMTMGPAELASARVAAIPPTVPMAAAAVPQPGAGGPGWPPPGPPPQPAGHPDGGAAVPPRRRRRKAPAVLAVTALIALVALVAGIAVVSGGEASADELYRDPAASAGPAPFMPSLVPASITPPGGLPPEVPPLTVPPLTLPPSIGVPGGGGGAQSIPGATPGLFGGTRQLSVCDASAMLEFLAANADKAAAWAAALGIPVDQIATYVSSLTDVILRADTRVTNHTFRDGVAIPVQSVLQAGTAVLVDVFGIPRVKCFCGNPLLPPAPLKKRIRYAGPVWPGFSPTNITVIVEGPRVDRIVIVDVRDSRPFARPVGTSGAADVDAPGSVVPPPVTSATAPTTATTATTLPATTALPPTTLPPTTVTVPKQKVNITREGSVSASSTFDGAFSPRLALDGDPSTSWFSKGDADGPTSTFTWRTGADVLITRVAITGNSRHANAAFRTGQGFRTSRVEVLDGAGKVVFSQGFSGPGSSSSNLSAAPNAVGRTVRLSLTGHENPECGGFSELTVEASR